MGYIDPGIFGMIAQIGYVLLFGIVSAVVFFFQPLKNLVNRVFKREQPSGPNQETENVTNSSQWGG